MLLFAIMLSVLWLLEDAVCTAVLSLLLALFLADRPAGRQSLGRLVLVIDQIV
jgi:hypothetical protein